MFESISTAEVLLFICGLIVGFIIGKGWLKEHKHGPDN
jgi:hypothetical protein